MRERGGMERGDGGGMARGEREEGWSKEMEEGWKGMEERGRSVATSFLMDALMKRFSLGISDCMDCISPYPPLSVSPFALFLPLCLPPSPFLF